MSTKYKATVKGDKEMHGFQIHAIGFLDINFMQTEVISFKLRFIACFNYIFLYKLALIRTHLN